METGWFTWMIRSRIFLFVLLLSLLSCRDNNQTDYALGADSIIKDSLFTADIVCRLGNGYFSSAFRKVASKEQKYSHIGLIAIEQDSVFVYHSEASELTGIGFVKRESLASFLFDIDQFAIYRINCSVRMRNAIIGNARCYYQEQVPFDIEFNSFDTHALYCSELVAVSINKAWGSRLISPTLNLSGKLVYALDDIYDNSVVRELQIGY